MPLLQGRTDNPKQNDPYQINNVYPTSSDGATLSVEIQLLGRPISKLLDRLDALTMVLKTCKAEGCVRPWKLLHPQGNVENLKSALNPKYDGFYAEEVPRVKYDHCAEGYFLELEGPRFDDTTFMFIT